jgi:hypothetical protein
MSQEYVEYEDSWKDLSYHDEKVFEEIELSFWWETVI